MIIYSINNLPKALTIGKQTETGVTQIGFDCAEWLSNWSNLALSAMVTPPGGEAAYPATTEMDGSVLVWTVSRADTVTSGRGTVEILGVADGLRKLSATIDITILRTTTSSTTEPPEAVKTWYDTVMEGVVGAEGSATRAAESAEEAKNALEDAENTLNSIPEDYTTLSEDVSSLKDHIVDKSEGLISTIEGSDLTICTDGMDKPLKSITVDGIGTDGAALMGFDKMVVLDGTEAWRAYTSFANAYRTSGVLKDALTTGYMQGVCDGYDVQRAADSRVNSLRLGSQSSNYEIFAFTDYAELDAFKASLAAQPKRLWYRSALYDANEPQYYAVCVNKSGNVDTAYAAIGTTEKINPLGEGDTIDFISGIVTRADGSKETIALNRTAVGLGGEALVINTHAKPGNIHVKYARDLAEKFQTVTGLDTPPPMLTIIDDDGHIGFHDVLLPVIKSKNVPIAAAVCTNRANGEVSSSSSWMSWDKILECYKSGAEILCHNYRHMSVEEMQAMTYDEIYHAFIKARNELRAHGVGGPNIFVYNGGTGDIEKVRKAASRVFDCAILPTGAVVNRTTDNRRWEIQRYGVGNYEVDALCERIDQCAAEGGWMVWMVHTSSEITADTVWKLEAAIDHAKEVGVDIVTAECGYRYYVDRFASR